MRLLKAAILYARYIAKANVSDEAVDAMVSFLGMSQAEQQQIVEALKIYLSEDRAKKQALQNDLEAT